MGIREAMITFITLADISAMNDLNRSNTLDILWSLGRFGVNGAPFLVTLPLPIEESGLHQLRESCENLFGLKPTPVQRPAFLDMYVDDCSLCIYRGPKTR